MWYGELTWWGWLVMSVSMAAFWGLVIVAAVYLIRGGRGSDSSPSSREILDERLARGEIDAEEYRERLETLGERHRSGAASR
jgi:putative membrane protein